MIDALSSRGIEILDEFISASLSSSDASCNDSGSEMFGEHLLLLLIP
jgi:hypothetical protein